VCALREAAARDVEDDGRKSCGSGGATAGLARKSGGGGRRDGSHVFAVSDCAGGGAEDGVANGGIVLPRGRTLSDPRHRDESRRSTQECLRHKWLK
jgi:hypothetical protein